MIVIKWLVTGCVSTGLLIAWLLYGQEWAGNLFTFWAFFWLLVVLVFILSGAKMTVHDGFPKWLLYTGRFIDVGGVVALIATGHFVVGSVWAIHLVLLVAVRHVAVEKAGAEG